MKHKTHHDILFLREGRVDTKRMSHTLNFIQKDTQLVGLILFKKISKEEGART